MFVAAMATEARPAGSPVPGLEHGSADTYAYLLGIYLGDGYLANASSRSARLEISLDPRYPKIVRECATAIERLAGIEPNVAVRKTPKGTGLRVAATSEVWVAVFPQHGRGRKHEHAIKLEPWQGAIVDRFPQSFLRGLIHSDGSRCINRFSVELASGPREYAYPRYFFTNLSADIRGLFCKACDALGIRWSRPSHKNVAISERRSVALLDSFVGPKE